jgi:hypothetical protein
MTSQENAHVCDSGLERYEPDDSRETRMLGRFPRRNRFISDYIFDKTGKRRSPKQVGSRLQKLRESCGTKCMALFQSRISHIDIVISVFTNNRYPLNEARLVSDPSNFIIDESSGMTNPITVPTALPAGLKATNMDGHQQFDHNHVWDTLVFP